MFTIRHAGWYSRIYGIEKIAIKYSPGSSSGPSSRPRESASVAPPDVDALLQQARAKLDVAKWRNDSIVAYREVHGSIFSSDSVKDILKQVMRINGDNKAKVDQLLADAMLQEEWKSSEKAKILADLRASFESDFQKIQEKQALDKAKVVSVAKPALAELAADHADARKSAWKKVEFQDITVKIEQKDGQITKDSMIALLSDFDGMSWVEKDNRSIFRQALFGGWRQKEVVGERQVYELLSRMSPEELSGAYVRITGDVSGLPWKATVYREGSSISDIDLPAKAKIVRFQRELADRSSMMADLTEAFIGKGARTWLRAVLEGSTDELQTAFNDRTKQEQYLKMIQDSKVLDRDPAYIIKVISFLLKVGIQVPLALLSQGIVGWYIESQKITPKGIEGSLTLDKNIGESGNVSASLDLLGVRLWAKWNSPTARITGLTEGLMGVVHAKGSDANSVQVGVDQITTKVLSEFQPPAQPDSEKRHKLLSTANEVLAMSNSYEVKVKETLLTTLPSEKKQEIIANLTMMYLSRVEAMKGAQLEGVFAAFNSAGWMVWVSGGRVDTSATQSGVREWSVDIEASALRKKELSGEALTTWLSKAGITKNPDGSYTFAAEGDKPAQKITIPSGKDASWNIVEHVYDDGVKVTANYSIVTPTEAKIGVAGRDKVEWKVGWTITVKRENGTLAEFGNRTLMAKASHLIHGLRQDPKHAQSMSVLNDHIKTESYPAAKATLEWILKWSKDPVAKELLGILVKPGTDLKSFFDRTLELSSGGRESMKIGAGIEASTPQSIEAYYEKYKLSKEFGQLFGLSESDVAWIIKQFGKLNKAQITSLWQRFPEGFTALTAFAQNNANKASFKALDRVTHTNARIIGEPKLVSGDQAIKIEQKLRVSLTQEDLDSYRKTLSKDIKVSDEELKDIIIKWELPKSLSDAGYTVLVKPQIQAYLSFVEDAQCFNLGFAITSPKIKIPDTPEVPEVPLAPVVPAVSWRSQVGTGTTVWYPETQHLEIGFWVWQEWAKKSENPQGPKTEPEAPPVKPPGTLTTQPGIVPVAPPTVIPSPVNPGTGVSLRPGATPPPPTPKPGG